MNSNSGIYYYWTPFKADKNTKHFFHGTKRIARLLGFAEAVLVALDKLNAAETIEDLRSPPGNRLEKLRGDRKGQHSIRVNIQYRICFRWGKNGPEEVEICDYHS